MIKVGRVFLMLFFFTQGAFLEAKGSYGNLWVTKVNRVYDGDTFMVDIGGVHPIIGKDISVRIRGIDTPEMTDKREEIKKLAIEARNYVAKRLVGSMHIELREIQRDKYFRLLADVYIDGSNIAQELLALGLAKSYAGKTKVEW